MPVTAKGRCAMSVSKKFNKLEYDNLIAWLMNRAKQDLLLRIPTWDQVRAWPGCIVATMDYEAVGKIPLSSSVEHECRIWNEGYPYWWLLSNVRKLSTPIPCRGNVGMWRLPSEIQLT